MTTAKQDSAKALSLAGSIRVNAEAIQNADVTSANYQRAQRISELCDELDEALMLDMLTASRLLVALKKLHDSAVPNAKEHPTMFPAWNDAESLIAEIEGRQG